MGPVGNSNTSRHRHKGWPRECLRDETKKETVRNDAEEVLSAMGRWW